MEWAAGYVNPEFKEEVHDDIVDPTGRHTIMEKESLNGEEVSVLGILMVEVKVDERTQQ